MAIIYHLKELKIRLLYLLVSLILTFAVCLFYWQELFFILIQPLAIERFIFTNLPEAFFVSVEISFIITICLNIPILCYHLWLFLSPALYYQERKQLSHFCLLSLVSLYLSLTICYYLLLPLFSHYFLGFQITSPDLSVEVEPRIGEYLNTLLPIVIFFIIVFQLPIFFYLLQQIFSLDLSFLVHMRPILYLVTFTISAFIAPPDVISQIIIVVPPLLIYELYLFLLFYLRFLSRSLKRDTLL